MYKYTNNYVQVEIFVVLKLKLLYSLLWMDNKLFLIMVLFIPYRTVFETHSNQGPFSKIVPTHYEYLSM